MDHHYLVEAQQFQPLIVKVYNKIVHFLIGYASLSILKLLTGALATPCARQNQMVSRVVYITLSPYNYWRGISPFFFATLCVERIASMGFS